jgi:hypothetical protein
MGMFEETFNRLLESDMKRVLQGKTGEHTPRHRRGIAAPGISAKHQHAVPKYMQVDGSLNPKVEQLRGKPFGKIVLNDSDLQNIMKDYSISNLSPDEPKQLGTTGIRIEFDGKLDNYCLYK